MCNLCSCFDRVISGCVAPTSVTHREMEAVSMHECLPMVRCSCRHVVQIRTVCTTQSLYVGCINAWKAGRTCNLLARQLLTPEFLAPAANVLLRRGCVRRGGDEPRHRSPNPNKPFADCRLKWKATVRPAFGKPMRCANLGQHEAGPVYQSWLSKAAPN